MALGPVEHNAQGVFSSFFPQLAASEIILPHISRQAICRPMLTQTASRENK